MKKLLIKVLRFFGFGRAKYRVLWDTTSTPEQSKRAREVLAKYAADHPERVLLVPPRIDP